MKTKNQILWTLLIFVISHSTLFFYLPFTIYIGTPFLLPISTLIVCFILGEKSLRFDFEKKAAIVFFAMILSIVIDRAYVAWIQDAYVLQQGIFFSYGLFILSFGLIAAKFYSDFSIRKLGLNGWTLLCFFELTFFGMLPFVYHYLFWTGKLFYIN